MIKKSRIAIDNYLNNNIVLGGKAPGTLFRAIRYSTLTGGKRIRPLLCIAAHRALGGRRKSILPLACAVELIHTFSLIHDDLPCMDDDDFRRGKPACHKVYGEDMAVLAGDELFNLAFQWAAEIKGLAGRGKIQVIRELTKASGANGLIGGQVLDLSKLPKKITPRYVLDIYQRKTAALICAAVAIGAIAAGAGKKQLNALTRFGIKIGLVFQLVDDLLDLRQDNTEKLQINYALLFGEDRTRKIIKQLADQALTALLPFGRKAVMLKTIAALIINQISYN